jgi:hypothetical protein
VRVCIPDRYSPRAPKRSVRSVGGVHRSALSSRELSIPYVGLSSTGDKGDALEDGLYWSSGSPGRVGLQDL